MSHSINALENKKQKVHFGQYLYNAHEPYDSISNDVPAELEVELLENSYFMRKRLRHIAHRLKNHRI